jgi:hypothetical protein
MFYLHALLLRSTAALKWVGGFLVFLLLDAVLRMQSWQRFCCDAVMLLDIHGVLFVAAQYTTISCIASKPVLSLCTAVSPHVLWRGY